MAAQLLSLLSLALASIAVCVAPGPNNFMLMRFGMRHGRGIAEASGLGTTLGCIVWCALAALGMAALLAAAPWLEIGLRIAGGLYLLWFAWTLWRAPPIAPEGAEAGSPPALSWPAAFWQGFVVNMANPKSVLYFASIFSAYVGPHTPVWVKLAAVAICVFTCQGWQSAMSWLFSTRRAVAAYARAQRLLDRLSGAFLGAFGVKLLWIFG
ncbi:LysE family translocator [Phenylobacterium sp.]|uniref:LysE family translocator n=1 Tax=Phenylobacterium sp. TaxID=1871053 RepID=UPI001229D5AF|nr:LysE family translocator [Phenylobacterium sp.]THD61490.1 MAG: LysE family translocator [Phenylobacterium sp.]